MKVDLTFDAERKVLSRPLSDHFINIAPDVGSSEFKGLATEENNTFLIQGCLKNLLSYQLLKTLLPMRMLNFSEGRGTYYLSSLVE